MKLQLKEFRPESFFHCPNHFIHAEEGNQE